MRRALLVVWLVLAGVHGVLCACWLASNLNLVPDYGDTGEYLTLAQTLEVDAYRGIAYPAFIAGVSHLPGADTLLRSAARGGGKADSGVLTLQAQQLLAILGALAYFLRTFVAPVEPRAGPAWTRRALGFLLLLLLFLDPLLAHFGLAIMTDGLALAASLTFCAALARLALGRSGRVLAATLLMLSFAALATLRPEKLAVLAATLLATLSAWLLLERRVPRETRRFTWARAGGVASLVVLAGLGVVALQRSTRVEGNRWPIYDSIVHSRIVFPNLTRVYEQLPEDVRSRVSLREAKKHDTDSIVAYRVIRDATGASGPRSAKDRRMAPGSNVRPAAEALRTSMLEEIAGVVLRERWPYLVADVLKDALENALATASYYVRLAVLARTGDVSCADGTQKTYETLAARHARISLYTALSGALLFLCSAPLAGVALVRRLRGGGGGLTRERCLAWLPVAAFVLANACAFALRADMVHIRYALLAHAALLVLAYRGALDFFFAHGQPTPAVAP